MEKIKSVTKHIVMKCDIPYNVACMPCMKSGETALLFNNNQMIAVVVDNSQVCPEYIKENKLENSVIVGTTVANALGIDVDGFGDFVNVAKM